jgi:hypothetical protein
MSDSTKLFKPFGRFADKSGEIDLVSSGSGWCVGAIDKIDSKLLVGDFNGDGIDDFLCAYPGVQKLTFVYSNNTKFYSAGDIDGIQAFCYL